MDHIEIEKQQATPELNRRVPKLRFQEFEGEWEKKKLDTVTDKITDGTHFSPPLLESGNYKYISSKNIRNGYMLLDDVPFVSDEDHQEIYSRCDVRHKDILLTKDGAGTGNVCLNELDEEFSLLSSVAFIRANQIDAINEFIYQYICSNYGQREVRSSIAGQAITRITLNKLRGFRFAYPTLPEQQKIAAFLSAVDEKIQQLTEKKELLEQYKKGVMQKLFSQEIRFKQEDGSDYPDWEEKRLGEVFNCVRGAGISKSEITDDGKQKCILYGELYTTYNEVVYEVVSATNSDDGVLSEVGDLLIPSSTTTTGIDLANVTALNRSDVLLGGDISILRSELDIDNVFYAYYLSNYKKHILAAFAQGSTIVHLSYNHFKVIDIDMPVLEEQRKIASYISGIDTKIESVATQIVHCQTFKKGLLQQMFV